MMVRLKKIYLLSGLFFYICAAQAQKNNYEDIGSVFNTRPHYPLLLFGSVKSIQIEDSVFIKHAYADTIEINYKGRGYWYDINRKTTREVQLYMPRDTSYDIEFLDHETFFVKKGTWGRSEQIWTEIDTLNKTVKSFHAKDGKVDKESITRYIGNFRPIEQHDFENGKEMTAHRKKYTSDGKLSLDAFTGWYNSFARSITYKQGKPLKEELYSSVNSLDSIERGHLYYRAEAVYGPEGAVVHFTYFEKGKKAGEEKYTYNRKGQLIVGHERKFHWVYTYDINGNVLSMISKDHNGDLIQKIVNIYNERQDLVQTTMDWYGDHTVETFTYVYDEKGNWIKQFRYKSGKLNAVITRKIEYYIP
jgi:hypothetical protein